jgi:ADP-heptose:LPS heptosyltransferase
MTDRSHCTILALFPGALGDLLCCWPALAALQRTSGAQLTLVARDTWFPVLPEGAVRSLSIDRREVADLFASAPLAGATRALFSGFARVESWTGHGNTAFERRLSEAGAGASVAVHPFRLLRPGEHASAYYARCVGIQPLVRTLPLRRGAIEWAEDLWQRHALSRNALVIHPGSGSVRKNWEGMPEVAAAWQANGGRVIALAGPAEDDRARSIPCDVAVHDQSLDRIAALLARVECYVGNDSGISHLAGAVGARGVALFGPTDPVAWRPFGDGIRVLQAPDTCPQCGADRFCTHRLPVAHVLAALGTMKI